MRELFLGKPWHWALVIAITLVLWWAGSARVHVTHFNLFVMALLLGALAVVVLVLWTTRPGEQVTREALEQADSSEAHGDEEGSAS